METASVPERITVGDLEIRPADGLVIAAGSVVMLSVREFGLLVALGVRAGRVVRRDHLYSTVWGRPLRSGDRSIDVYVHKLRAKLEGALPDGRRYIHTHVGFGYRLDPELSHALHTKSTGS